MSGIEIDLDEELLQEFHTEVADIIEGLGDDFMTIEEQIGNLPPELVDQIFRGLHTIKGNAGFVGLPAMSKLAHAMEDIFSAVRENSLAIATNHMDYLFAGIDALKEMLKDPRQSAKVETTDLVGAYRAILNGTLTTAPSEPKDSLLNQFLNSDDLFERINLLQDIEKQQQGDSIPALLEFIEHPFDDDPLNTILDSTVKTLMQTNPAAILEGLDHSGVKVQTLCAQLAGKHALKEATGQLLQIIGSTTEPELLRTCLKSLGELQDPMALDMLQEYAFNADPVLAATAVAALGLIQPDFAALQTSFDRLPELPALAMLEGMTHEDSSVTFLVDHIHHPNSIIRRVIAGNITQINEPAIDPLAQKLMHGNRDEKIMSANILAGMNQQRIFPYLVAATREKDENIRFAAYEALGHISSSQTCYTCYDGIFDPSLSIRSLVLTYLEENVCAVVAGKIRRNLQKNDTKAERIREAMAHVAATEILGRLSDYPDIFPAIFTKIKQQSSILVLEQYKSLLLRDTCKELLKIWNTISVAVKDSSALKEHRILVVDDSATVLRISTNVLNKVGYTTFTAMDGQQGLKILAKQPVDLVITDMNMPVMTGIEMAREIRQNILLESIPIIMITTEQNDNEKQQAKAAGINVFLTKPFKPKELLDCLDSLLPE